MSDITPKNIVLEDSERKNLRKIVLPAGGDTSLWIKTSDVYAIDVSGITADTIEMYATNDKDKATSGGTQIGVSIEADDLQVGDSPYIYMRVARTGSADGDITILLSTSEK